MRVLWARVGLCGAALLMGLPVGASVAPLTNPVVLVPGKIVAPYPTLDNAKTMRESLRLEVSRHPGDFIVFVTEAGAKQFLVKHRYDVEHETNPRIVSRGVVGYWQDKTIVVLPWGALDNFQ